MTDERKDVSLQESGETAEAAANGDGGSCCSTTCCGTSEVGAD